MEKEVLGAVGSTVDIDTDTSAGACGYPFVLGTKYLVYPTGSAQGWQASLCSRTTSLEDGQIDLELIKETADGHIRPRLTGSVYTYELDLDGFYMHSSESGPMRDLPLTIRGPGGAYSTRTSRSGEFVVTGLAPGQYTVEPAWPPTYGSMLPMVWKANVTDCLAHIHVMAGRRLLTGTVRLSSGRLAGRGLWLRAAKLDALNHVYFDRTTLAFTADDGSFAFPGLPTGRYLLGVNTYDAPDKDTPYATVWFPNAATAAEARVIDVVEGKPQHIEFTLPPPLTPISLEGRVVDEGGRPIANASVSVSDDDDEHAKESWPSPIASMQTDASGAFRAVGFAGRRYHVEATAPREAPRPGPAPKSERVAIAAGAKVELVINIR